MLWTLAMTAAHAHIALEDPAPRYPSDGSTANKACPCGVGESNRYCDVPGDRADPDRNEAAVTTYQTGETITLRFRETIGHSGRYRVAFDADGANQRSFDENILLDVPDPAGSEGNVGQGDLWELEVTLPDTPCDNCTLQLIQMMDGNTTDPVPDPVGRSSYYQCVDIVLTGDPVDTDPLGGDTGSEAAAVDSGGGCGCASPAPTPSGLAILALCAVLGRRRR